MFALTISIICFTLFSLVYKMTARKGYDALTVATVQYVTALVFVSAATLVLKPAPLNLRAIGLGVCGGTSMFVAIGTFFYVVRYGYLSVSWAIINLSVMIPVLASVAFWHEVPNVWQLVGLVFVAAALLTPTPDAFNQTLMAVPIIVLYEGGLIAARIFASRRRRALEREEKKEKEEGSEGP